jgi:hypothetical protein
MLPWKKLIEDAQTLKIDRRQSQALAWIRRHLPELSLWYDAENGARTPAQDLFTWEAEWPAWQDNFEALHWLVRARALPPKPRRPEQRIPHRVRNILHKYLSQTRNVILSDWITEARISLQLSGGFTATGRFQSLGEFWQAVFVSFFEPEAVNLGYCSDCGKPLARTAKLQKASRARLCAACRVKQWRRAHPEAARELWRRSKAGASTRRRA